MILHGDCLDKLKDLPANSVDAIVTDPPYGLSFMGKKWDYDVPSEEIWKEALRVLKPGGHVLSFCGTRTYHRMVVRIEDAGFEIRDQIQWIYGSGFPKSHNIKDGDFKGWGTALKPANEPICLARKPLEGTVAQNVLKWGTGAINVDAGRIEGKPRTTHAAGNIRTQDNLNGIMGGGMPLGSYPSAAGRWPANVIFDEEAAAMLDEQSGYLHGAGNKNLSHPKASPSFGIGNCGPRIPKIVGDNGGGASRFFYCAKASKSERNEGLEGMVEKEKKTLGNYVNPSEGRTASKSGSPSANYHPTIKPIKLMEYLIKLITPPNGTVLDPFMGSGSTGVAAKRLGFNFIGIEREAEYVEIAEKRIEAV